MKTFFPGNQQNHTWIKCHRHEMCGTAGFAYKFLACEIFCSIDLCVSAARVCAVFSRFLFNKPCSRSLVSFVLFVDCSTIHWSNNFFLLLHKRRRRQKRAFSFSCKCYVTLLYTCCLYRYVSILYAQLAWVNFLLFCWNFGGNFWNYSTWTHSSISNSDPP